MLRIARSYSIFSKVKSLVTGETAANTTKAAAVATNTATAVDAPSSTIRGKATRESGSASSPFASLGSLADLNALLASTTPEFRKQFVTLMQDPSLTQFLASMGLDENGKPRNLTNPLEMMKISAKIAAAPPAEREKLMKFAQLVSSNKEFMGKVTELMGKAKF